MAWFFLNLSCLLEGNYFLFNHNFEWWITFIILTMFTGMHLFFNIIVGWYIKLIIVTMIDFETMPPWLNSKLCHPDWFTIVSKIITRDMISFPILITWQSILFFEHCTSEICVKIQNLSCLLVCTYGVFFFFTIILCDISNVSYVYTHMQVISDLQKL